MKIDNKQLIKDAIIVLDQKVEALDSKTLHFLRAARNHALLKQQKKIVKWLKCFIGASTGIILVSVLLFFVVPYLLMSNQLSPLDDIEILISEADMDIVTQLEFYEWLDESLAEEPVRELGL